jgi:hypothetical protein
MTGAGRINIREGEWSSDMQSESFKNICEMAINYLELIQKETRWPFRLSLRNGSSYFQAE